MKNFMVLLDEFFLSNDPEEISISDRLIFYGFYIAITVIALMVAIELYL